ncbi:uncharacterized protein LOC120347104 [Styela clava]
MKLKTCSMDKNGILWWISIISLSISLNEAGRCTDCTNTILGTKSENITFYGPTNDFNCECEWTIPTSMKTDHKTAIVLMLQNVSLPLTTSSSTDCSASIRFPGADGAECEFPINYCLTFATASTICNINKIREKISVANHTCDSIMPWNKAGGSPYKIQYFAGNYADHTKYFTIQYLVIDCRPQTTTPEEETTAYTEIISDNNTTMIKQSISTEITGSTTQIVSKNPAATGENITVVATRPIEATSVPQVQAINSTAVIIIAASVAGLITIVISVLLIRSVILGTENENITYGPSNELNCQCDWTIPTSMDTDHETAVVLLLQNVSLPMTTDGITDCSGEIRFPSTNQAKCEFPTNYCLVFATGSTICNINKTREKIPVANHTCDSIIPWNRVGGSPYKIEYYAGNHAGYSKYFTIQYLVIDCRPATTKIPLSTTEAAGFSTTPISTIGEKLHNSSTGNAELEATTEQTESFNHPTTIQSSTPNTELMSNTKLIIIIAASGLGSLIIVTVILLIGRYHCPKKSSTTIGDSNDNTADAGTEREIVDNPLYGTTPNGHQSEIIINGIYDTTTGSQDIEENAAIDEPCVYAVIQKKDSPQNEMKAGTVIIEDDEPSSLYAVVHKDKK